MKKRICLFGICIALCGPLAAQQGGPDSLWDSANHAYTVGDYPAAIAAYDSIRTSGYSSAKLYYNLGNAYYKDNRIGRAILNYRRAERLDPSDAAIRHNLAVAGASVRERIEPAPEFFAATWLRGLTRAAGADGWATLFLVFLALALACVLVYLFAGRMGRRKAGFYGAAGALALAAGSLVFALTQRRELLHPDEAVVMITAAPVKSEPNNASRDLFVIHEGTSVRVVAEMEAWREIVLADGNSGWIEAASIELID